MLAPEFLPVWGGVGSYIVELVKHLPKDMEVHVVTVFRKSIGKYNVSSDEYDYSIYFDDNVHIHFISTASDTFIYNLKFQYSVARYVPKLIKDEKIDIVHSHTAHMPDLLLQFRNVKLPIVTTIHTTIKGQREGTKNSGMGFWKLELSEKATFLIYPLLRLAEEIYFMKDRFYITVSNWMKEQLIRQYPKLAKRKIYVVHNAVDTEFFSYTPNTLKDSITEKKDIVLFTGRLIAAKGANILVKAIPLILKNYKDVFFLFIGPGNPEPYIESLKKLGVPKSHYKFLGYIKRREELVNYYRAADIFVAPTFYENLPIRILEAMSCGVPVVASSVCAIPEAVKNFYNGILVPPGNHEALASAILYLLQNPKERKRMGANARYIVERNFSWNVNAKKIVNIYSKILEISK
jgi:glycosyltransferase involved in cell wall biosynthesis